MNVVRNSVQDFGGFTPVVVRLPVPLSSGSVQLAYLLPTLRARAILLEAEPIYLTLRRQMTRVLDLGGHVEEWLRLRGLRPSVLLRAVVRDLFSDGARYATIGEFLASEYYPARTVAAHLAAAHLPSASRWHQLARALRAAMQVQGHEKSLLAIAHELGYSDHSGLSRQVLRCFGLRPGALRGTLGWEWPLERWLRTYRRGYRAA